jgi:hypothetical protein
MWSVIARNGLRNWSPRFLGEGRVDNRQGSCLFSRVLR